MKTQVGIFIVEYMPSCSMCILVNLCLESKMQTNNKKKIIEILLWEHIQIETASFRAVTECRFCMQAHSTVQYLIVRFVNNSCNHLKKTGIKRMRIKKRMRCIVSYNENVTFFSVAPEQNGSKKKNSMPSTFHIDTSHTHTQTLDTYTLTHTEGAKKRTMCKLPV